MDNNGWITDRLPTAEDGDNADMVWVWFENLNRCARNMYQCVTDGTPWQRIIEPPPYVELRWKPKKNEYYWCVYGSTTQGFTCFNDEIDNKFYEIGNCFQTKEEAEEVFEKFTQVLKEHHDGQ